MKRLSVLLLGIAVAVSVTACGKTAGKQEPETQVVAEESTSETDEAEEVQETMEPEESETVEESAEPEKVVDTTPVIAVGETATTDQAEFSIDYVTITNDVVPPQPGSWYSHYEADAGKAYVDVCFAYKNTSGSNVKADDVISAKLKYAGKYDYKGFSMIEEDSRGDFTYSSITSIAPLNTEYIHYLFEVPEEVETSSESIEVTFMVDGNTYTYTVR